MLRIRGLRKEFAKDEGTMLAIDDLNLDIEDGEFVCVLGPSGCGKTTVLRMIAGLETKTSGRCFWAKRRSPDPARIGVWSSRSSLSYHGGTSGRTSSSVWN